MDRYSIFQFMGIALLAALWLVPGPAKAEPRVALVIGNASYGDEIGPLETPLNDTKLIAETLRAVGFEVIEAPDADWRNMRQAIRTFSERLRRIGKSGTALFYYTGHSVQIDGGNFLIPIGAEVRQKSDIEVHGISTSTITEDLKNAKVGTNIIILDAGRSSPFPAFTDPSAKGLAQISAPRGSYVVYAAAPGETALESYGNYSSFAVATVNAMAKPGLPVELTFKQVRQNVDSATEGLQTPWTSSSLNIDFHFIEPGGKPISVPKIELTDPELELWNQVKTQDTEAGYQAYLDRYPKGRYAVIAAKRLKRIKQQRAKTAALASEGPRNLNFSGEFFGHGGGFWQHEFCGSRVRSRMEVSILGDTVSGTIFGTRKVKLQGTLTGENRVRGKLVGAGGGSRFAVTGSLSANRLTIEVGGETTYCTGSFRAEASPKN